MADHKRKMVLDDGSPSCKLNRPDSPAESSTPSGTQNASVSQKAESNMASKFKDRKITVKFLEDLLKTCKGRKQFENDARMILREAESYFKQQPAVVEITVPDGEKISVVGDINGSLEDLLYIFEINGFPSGNNRYVFNGNFGGRGGHSVECLLLLLAYKLLYPNAVFLNRGSYERQDNYSKKTIKSKHFNGVLQWLPVAHLINSKVFVLFGGLFQKITLDDITNLRREDLSLSFRSKPQDEDSVEVEWQHSFNFGPTLTESFCTRNNVDYIIRSHSEYPLSTGYKMEHDGHVITVNSCPGYLKEGAMIQLCAPELEPRFITWKDSLYRMYPNPAEVELNCAAPKLEGGKITVKFMEDLIKMYKGEEHLPEIVVYTILQEAKEYLETLPSLVEITVPNDEKITVVGDIHGYLYDLLHIFEINGLPSEENRYLFNGDFVDRGRYSMECVLIVLSLKLLYPNAVFLNRGNHETLEIFNDTARDCFRRDCLQLYSWKMIDAFQEVFQRLPVAHLINEKVLVVHGGLFSKKGVTLEDIKNIKRITEPKEPADKMKLDGDENSMLPDILWSDPQDKAGREYNWSRDRGIRFGPDVTKSFCSRNKLDYIIRSHEPISEGYKVEHDGQTVTVHSCPIQWSASRAIIKLSAPELKPDFVTWKKELGPRNQPQQKIVAVAYPSSIDGGSQNQTVKFNCATPKLEERKVTVEFVEGLIQTIREELQLEQDVFMILREAKKYFEKQPSLVEIVVPDGQKLTVVGDIHGHLYDLFHIFDVNGLPSAKNFYLFNGDLGGRGDYSTACIMILLTLKLLYPSAVFMNCGQQETELGFKFRENYSEKEIKPFDEVFQWLPVAHLINKKILVLSGGSNRNASLKDIKDMKRNDPAVRGGEEWSGNLFGGSSSDMKRMLQDILWAQPQGEEGYYRPQENWNALVIKFGPDVTKSFCTRNNVDYIIRSHSEYPLSTGYKMEHDGHVITVNSCPGYLKEGAMIQLSAPELKPKFITWKDSLYRMYPNPAKVALNCAAPKLEGGKITVKFMEDLIKMYKEKQLLPEIVVYTILLQAKEYLQKLPSLVEIPIPDGENITVVGDIHGYLKNLLHVFEINELPSEKNRYLFNGNIVDSKNGCSIECIMILLGFKLLYPDAVFLNRGKHETTDKMYGYRGKNKGLGATCIRLYSEKMVDAFQEVFQWLPVAHLINKKVLVVPGGLFSRRNVTLEDIVNIKRNTEPERPKRWDLGDENSMLFDILWSDPQNEDGRCRSGLCDRMSFGPDVTKAFCSRNKLDFIIHSCLSQGYKVQHDGQLITVYTACGDHFWRLSAIVRLSAPELKPEFITWEWHY